jgi:hypothetical protein
MKDKRIIIERYLRGESPQELAREFDVHTRTITALVNNNPVTRSTIEKKTMEVGIARETARIQEIKDKMLTYIDQTVEEGLTKENKGAFIDTILTALTQLDKIGRLNRDKPTNIDETTDKKIIIDAAKIMKELDTPEKQRAFLLDQISM